MCELTLQVNTLIDPLALNHPKSGKRVSDKGLLPITLADYLALLDWTGRQVQTDKRGAIPDTLAPILDRLGINKTLWTELATEFEQRFGRVVGRAADLAHRAIQSGRQFYRGQKNCAAAFH